MKPRNITLLSNMNDFQEKFQSCCEIYDKLEMYIAWVGNPKNFVPFEYLEKLNNVKIHVGIAFDHTNPDGIQFLMDSGHDVEIVDSKDTYHPKLYFFTSKEKSALIIGSSNFTYSGFASNIEGNVLIEGNENKAIINNYLKEIRGKIKQFNCFVPDEEWLADYRKRYDEKIKNFKAKRIKDESILEEDFVSRISWLDSGEWIDYLNDVKRKTKINKQVFAESIAEKVNLLDEYHEYLEVPWNNTVFETIENRRRLLGIHPPYGWLGHIGASGRIKHLFAKGTKKEKAIICSSINRISTLELPLDYKIVRRELENLQVLGPTIKVWGRLLAITRPDLYCTVSSTRARESMAELLDKKESYFYTTDGYIELIKLIHNSPWYNSPRPSNELEAQIWDRRVAFLDVVFY
jgi:HKD family nuclease